MLLGCGASAPGANVESRAPALVAACNGAAISAAVAAGGDVAVDCGPGPVTLAVPPTSVAHDTVLHALRPGTITFTNTATLFEVNAGVSFEIRDFAFFGSTLSPIVHTVGGTITLTRDSFSNFPGFVISVHNGAKLTVTQCSFANNGVGQSSAPFAGSIYNEGSVTSVQSSTFNNNHSTGSGGAITNFGSLTVSGSTFANNGAGSGGAIYTNGFASTLQIVNSTFENNLATNGAGAIFYGGFQNQATIQSSTFSDNPSSRGTFFGNIALFDSILVDPIVPSTPCTLAGTGNLQWPAGPPLCGAGFVRGDPNLAPLADNGGPTPTMAIRLPSAAFRGATAGCPATDQRAVSRSRDRDANDSGICDIGAFEL
jgi:hypothetical protein